jgi:hypothetical protein
VDDIRRGSRLRRGENVHTNGGSKIPGEDHREEWSSVLENSTSWTVEVAEREEEDDGFECPSRNELVLERPCGRSSQLRSSELALRTADQFALLLNPSRGQFLSDDPKRIHVPESLSTSPTPQSTRQIVPFTLVSLQPRFRVYDTSYRVSLLQ